MNKDPQAVEVAAAGCIQNLFQVLQAVDGLDVPADSVATSLLGYGWWVRVVRTAEAVRLLHEQGFGHEASPMVRTVLHHAAAISWLIAEPDEVLAAVRYDHERRRQRLGQKAGERNWDLAGIELGPPPTGEKPAGLELLDRFEKLCKRVNADNLYVAHVIESAYAHPSGTGADIYLAAVEGDLMLRSEASLPGVSLRATANFATAATSEFGTFIGSERMTDAADGCAESLAPFNGLAGG